MRRFTNLVRLALLALPLSACAHHIPASVFVRDSVRVACCGRSDEPVEITFLGVSGWLIEKGGVQILTAPLFSNPGWIHAGLMKIGPDTGRIERHLPDVRGVSAILVGHGHYDHAMDVPYVAMARAPNAMVYTNETAAIQLEAAGLDSGRIRVVAQSEVGSTDKIGTWIPIAPRVRMMPLLSHHGPHLAGYTLYKGVRNQAMKEPPRTADDWLDGNTIAFLIDFLTPQGSVAFRVYFQDAVPEPPFGFVPPMPDSIPPDVALLVPSTYGEVQWHPEAFLSDAKPRHVLLGHWETFFQSPDIPPRPVPTSDLAGFIWRLERALPAGSGWNIPMPKTRFIFN